MNKIDLIEALKEEAAPTKIEAKKVITLFLTKWPKHLQKVTGLKSGDYAHFKSRNTEHMPEEIRKPENQLILNLRSFRFSSVGRKEILGTYKEGE